MTESELMLGPTVMYFNKLPVRTSVLLVKEYTKVKRWRRLNRPAKIKKTTHIKPSNEILHLKDIFGNPYLVCHPAMLPKLERK
jgi:hypothetical protein